MIAILFLIGGCPYAFVKGCYRLITFDNDIRMARPE